MAYKVFVCERESRCSAVHQGMGADYLVKLTRQEGARNYEVIPIQLIIIQFH